MLQRIWEIWISKNLPYNVNINQDCGALLRKTDREIKVISYQLANIVSNGENHIMIQNKMPQMIEVIEGTPIFSKIMCGGSNSPCKINMEYHSKGDLKIFVSLTNKTPTAEDCGKVYSKVKWFSVFAKEWEK